MAGRVCKNHRTDFWEWPWLSLGPSENPLPLSFLKVPARPQQVAGVGWCLCTKIPCDNWGLWTCLFWATFGLEAQIPTTPSYSLTCRMPLPHRPRPWLDCFSMVLPTAHAGGWGAQELCVSFSKQLGGCLHEKAAALSSPSLSPWTWGYSIGLSSSPVQVSDLSITMVRG